MTQTTTTLGNLAKRSDMDELAEMTWIAEIPIAQFIRGRAKDWSRDIPGFGSNGGARLPHTRAPSASGGLAEGNADHIGRSTALTNSSESVTSPVHGYQSIQFRP